MKKKGITRRQFIQAAAITTGGTFFIARRGFAAGGSPNEKLNIGVVGVAHRGGANLNGVASQNIVALCDVDDRYLRAAGERFPHAKRYHDFRKMLDQKNIDAVVVSTPDHVHAMATLSALESGRDVYCEKPLAHTVEETRVVERTARHYRRVTQMGTQIHATNNYRRVVELIKTGAIGPVREVHDWVGSVWSGPSVANKPSPPVPDYLHWDLWLGPADRRPYHPEYLPVNWRGYWDFGGGAMADMACHHMDLPFWALDLRYPLTIEAEGPPPDPVSAPAWQIVHFHYSERGELPAVHLTWYNGDKRPHYFAEGKLPKWGNGTLFVGERGMLLADYGKHVLLPEKKFDGFVPPTPFIPNSIGHHKEWIEACKTRGPTTCNFTYSGTLTESVLLGDVAFRVGKKLEWDPVNLVAKNCPEATPLIRFHHRAGWGFPAGAAKATV